MNWLKQVSYNHKDLYSLYIVFAVLMTINVIMDPTIFTIERISTLSLQYMPLILTAMAQTVIMLTGGIDLSIGSVLSLMTTIAAVTMFDSAMGITISIAITLLCGGLIGLFTGMVVTFGRLPAIIVTLATSYIWHGIALFVLPTPGGNIAGSLTKWVSTPAIIPAGVILIVIPILAWKYVKGTPLGIGIYSIGDNEHAAYVSGIKVNRTRILAYVIAGVLMAVAGIGLSGQIGSGDPNIGIPYTLNSITAAVLGGIAFFGGQGKMKGAIIGAIIVGSLMNILFFSGISPFYQYIFQGLILIIAIGIKSFARMNRGELIES